MQFDTFRYLSEPTLQLKDLVDKTLDRKDIVWPVPAEPGNILAKQAEIVTIFTKFVEEIDNSVEKIVLESG